MIKIKQGVNLPIAGEPEQVVYDAPTPQHVAILGPDYQGMKPTMLVQVGDQVKKGQPLFEDKKNPGVLFTAPGGGKVSAINRGEKRVLLSVVIDLDAVEQAVQFARPSDLAKAEPAEIAQVLVASGLWTAFRTRPFSKTPHVGSSPAAIFVNAMDTNPLAADPGIVIAGQEAQFKTGLLALQRLTPGKTYLCHGEGGFFPTANLPGITLAKFGGKHPAGLSGTHIHHLEPVGPHKTVWTVNYQDVIAIGKFFQTGELDCSRVISLAGPQVKNPRLLRTRLGARVSALVQGELKEGENRIVSGSVFYGHVTAGDLDFLGRFSSQISVLQEGRDRKFMAFQRPGFEKYSVLNVFASAPYAPFLVKKFTTNQEGSHRAMVPSGNYELVLPFDTEPVYLLRAMIMKDTDLAQGLGALELDEEDLALCTFVDTGKHDFGPLLRETLNIIEKEG